MNSYIFHFPNTQDINNFLCPFHLFLFQCFNFSLVQLITLSYYLFICDLNHNLRFIFCRYSNSIMQSLFSTQVKQLEKVTIRYIYCQLINFNLKSLVIAIKVVYYNYITSLNIITREQKVLFHLHINILNIIIHFIHQKKIILDSIHAKIYFNDLHYYINDEYYLYFLMILTQFLHDN